MTAPGTRAAFLDRDGVLNHLVARDGRLLSPRTVADFHLYDDAVGAVARLRALGLLVFVVSNQPDVARGVLSSAELERMTALLSERLHPDDVAICPHDDADGCDCRKPRPGLVMGLASRWNVDLPRSFVIGDTWRDMEAGRQAGCATILVARDGAGDGDPPDAHVSVKDLKAAVDYIASRI